MTFFIPPKSRLTRFAGGWPSSPKEKPTTPAKAVFPARGLYTPDSDGRKPAHPSCVLLDSVNLANQQPISFVSKTISAGDGWYGTIADDPAIESNGFNDHTFIFDITTGPTDSRGVLCQKTVETSGQRTVRINVTTFSAVDYLVANSSGAWAAANLALPFSLGFGERYTLVFRCRGPDGVSYTTLRDVFVNGQKGTTHDNSSTAGDTAFKDTANDWNIGNANQIVHGLALINSALSDEECLRISNGFYGELIEPANQSPFPIGTAAAGGLAALPSGVSVGVGIGSPTLTPGAVNTLPDGVSITVGIGAPTVTAAIPGTALPAGVGVEVGIGSPALVPGAVNAVAAGVPIEIGIGAPVAAITVLEALPVGVSIEVGIGSAIAWLQQQYAESAGVSVQIGIGSPTLSGGGTTWRAVPPAASTWTPVSGASSTWTEI